MSVPSVGSNQTQTIGTMLLQQLMANESNSQNTSGTSGILGDQLTLSPAAQQLTQVPEAVSQAVGDLFSSQKDVRGDLAKLQGYFQQNPQSLTSLLSSLQGGTSTYSASNTTAKNALLTALMNGQSNSSDPAALLSLLQGNQGQHSLFDFLGSSNGESNSSAVFG